MFENVIVDQNQHWDGAQYDGGVPRSYFTTGPETGKLRPVIIPTCKEIDVDIILSNIRTAGMTRERYFELLKIRK